jgi:hypothetical protein
MLKKNLVEVYLRFHFNLDFSQPRRNRPPSPPRTVSCKLPCYFSHFQIWKNGVERSDIADSEDARMALKLTTGKIIVRMASANI